MREIGRVCRLSPRKECVYVERASVGSVRPTKKKERKKNKTGTDPKTPYSVCITNYCLIGGLCAARGSICF